jgi:hypothetical protein
MTKEDPEKEDDYFAFVRRLTQEIDRTWRKAPSAWKTPASCAAIAAILSAGAAGVSAIVAGQAYRQTRPHHDFSLSAYDFSYFQDQVKVKLAFQNRGNQGEVVYRVNFASLKGEEGLVWAGNGKRNALDTFNLPPGAVSLKTFCEQLNRQSLDSMTSTYGQFILGLEVTVLDKNGLPLVQQVPIALLKRGRTNEWASYGDTTGDSMLRVNLLGRSNIKYIGWDDNFSFISGDGCYPDSLGSTPKSPGRTSSDIH